MAKNNTTTWRQSTLGLAQALALAGLATIASGCAISESLLGNNLEAMEAIVADPTRLEEHRERDADRKPALILEMSRLESGDRVADIAPSSGYYTALLSRVVGDEGRVFAVDPERIFEHFPQGRDGFPSYLEQDPRINVEHSSQNLDALRVSEQLDAIFMVLYYHDTIWTGENRAAMNRAMLGALKPGGRLIVVDHSALEDAGDEVTRSLHRMEESVMESELTGVGFRVVKRSDVLRNADDPRDVSVFDPTWRGKTDRFVTVFQRP